MINRQLSTMKFHSSRLKKYNYDIKIDYNEALKNKEIIKLSDNQLLRTIRDVVLKKTNKKERVLDRNLLEKFYENLEKVKRKKNSQDNVKKIKEINKNIIDMCFIPEYITIVMDNPKHYDYLYENGLKINGIIYYRLSVSAGQGRVSTVVFCSEEVLESVNEILDNGRDKNKKFSPSKFNAYKGTYGTATKVVSTPRFCVVPDYESECEFKVNWVTETEGEQDDLIEERVIKRKFNRWDGMGLISPVFAKRWSEDLGLDYIPAEFCFRQSFVKGMLCVFDFHLFCEEENDNDYIVNSVYKDLDGNNIKIDLRDYDVILTESQFKLWDSYSSLDIYKENCIKNNLKWGVALHTDKVLKDTLKYNYQFLQALDIPKERVPELCEEFVKWISGVTVDDKWYTLLFLMGSNISEDGIKKYLKNSKDFLVKSCIVNNDLLRDKYVKEKVYNMIKTKIDQGCIGNIILSGNNQTLVSDPYAMMEYLCGKEVKGLLPPNKYYSNYWSSKGVNEILGCRPPLTYRSECLRMELEHTKKQQKWYKYLYGGIIVNVHGWETDIWAGSDWDYDFLSTTSNRVVIESVHKGELPVAYEAPKPNKFVFTDKDLFNSDKFTFGSKIGAITNKSTTGHALLKTLEYIYGTDSREYKTTLNRVKMCTKLQSAQIDKAKIGRNVKGIPKIWTDRKYIDSLEIDDNEKNFLKRIMLDRHPYFFIHLYYDTKRKYKKYIEGYDLSCKHKFGISINELINKNDKTEKELMYLNSYYEFMPVIDSDCVMNNICKYIESINFDIKNKVKKSDFDDVHEILMRNENIKNEDTYSLVLKEYKKIIKEIKNIKSIGVTSESSKYDDEEEKVVNNIYEEIQKRMESICSDVGELVDYLIRIFYIEYPNSNKSLLWNTYGQYIYENVKDKSKRIIEFPFPNEEGSMLYLNEKFSLKEVYTDEL